jgi:hypothetical protein
MNLKELVLKMSGDKNLAKKYENLDVQDFVEQAEKDGCVTSVSEIEALLAGENATVLTDSELEGVAGGSGLESLPPNQRDIQAELLARQLKFDDLINKTRDTISDYSKSMSEIQKRIIENL